MKLKGKIRIEFHDTNGKQTQEPVEETNLIFNQTYLTILDVSPNAVFAAASILISSTTTPPDFNAPTITNVLAGGSVPSGVTSPIWYESITPNFGEIQNQIAAPTTARTFYTVGLRAPIFGDLTATLLTIPCTQNAFEILTIYYRIEVMNSSGERLSPRFTRDFGGKLFNKKECFHGTLGTSYCNAPSNLYPYIDTQQDISLINTAVSGGAWGAAAIISSHYKYKENRTFKIAQSGVPGDTDEFVGYIFNSLLTGNSNKILPGVAFIAANYTENTSSAYRVSAYAPQTVNIDPTKPVFQPPFQKIWSHRINAPLPFFDPSNAAIGTAYPMIAGTWTGIWPELYRYTITLGGAMGTSQYKFSKRLHLGFNGNAYSDRTVICPFRNPNTPAAAGMHGWRFEDNDLLRWSSTQIVQYDNTGVTLLDLMDGSYTNWDATTTPILNVTKLRQCAVDTTNQLIYCACRDTGLWIIDVANGTTIQQIPTPCYGVDVGRNNVAVAIVDGGIYQSTDWTTPVTFTFTGISDGNWSRVFFLKADPEDTSDRLAIVADNGSGIRRVVWAQLNPPPLPPTPTATRYWRVKNTTPATGGDAQWICYELIFQNEFGIDITVGGTSTNTAAFDKNGGTFSSIGVGANLTLQYTFASPVVVYQLLISNLNNGSNIPPTNYDLEYSPDNISWMIAGSFTTGTNSGQYYPYITPYLPNDVALGYEGAEIKQWAASLDVSDTGGFWAIASLRLFFGTTMTQAIASPPVQSLIHSVWGNVNLYKISFYTSTPGNEFLIGNTAIVNSSNISQNAYAALGTTATVLHMQGGIVALSNAVRQLFTDNIYAWENYGWNGSNWILNNTNSKPTHTSIDTLIQGLTIQWMAGTFQLGDFFTQGILNGTWKDNATTVFIENFWYTKAVHFDVALPGALTVPAIAPYEIPFPAASNPVFARIETDSVSALNKFTIGGVVVPTIYVNGESAGPGELTIYPTGAGAKAVFNAVDAGKTWAGTYSWIEV